MKTMTTYTLTFQDGTSLDQTFEGFLQFKNDEVQHLIVKAELIRQWEEKVVEPVAVVEESASVEKEVEPVEVVEKPVQHKFKRK